MSSHAQPAPRPQRGVVFEVRALSNRWLEPMKGDVISTHTSAKAAMDALGREPQTASDGTGRTTHGSFVPRTVVRIDAQGNESVVLAPPLEGGTLAWPYSN